LLSVRIGWADSYLKRLMATIVLLRPPLVELLNPRRDGQPGVAGQAVDIENESQGAKGGEDDSGGCVKVPGGGAWWPGD
jgi:hypothetical protein